MGRLWEGYNARFIRTGSFFPVLHAMSGLAGLQLLVWGVKGLPIGPEHSRQLMGANKDTSIKPR